MLIKSAANTNKKMILIIGECLLNYVSLTYDFGKIPVFPLSLPSYQSSLTTKKEGKININ